MAKILPFEVEYDYDFQLLGIICHLPDYRLCWTINKTLELQMSLREDTLQSLQKDKATVIPFNVFCTVVEDLHVELYLIDNINEGHRLIPELKNIDYLFMVKGGSSSYIKHCKNALQKADHILGVIDIPVESLKSKEKLLF